MVFVTDSLWTAFCKDLTCYTDMKAGLAMEAGLTVLFCESAGYTFEKEKILITCGAARQKCSLPSYTKCSYVLSRMSQQPAAAHSSLARSTCCLLSRTPAKGLSSSVQTSVIYLRLQYPADCGELQRARLDQAARILNTCGKCIRRLLTDKHMSGRELNRTGGVVRVH